MISELKYFNYIYLDPRKPGVYTYKDVPFIFKYEPFYVGKAASKKRMKSHLSTSLNIKYASGKFKCSLIKAIKNAGLTPIYYAINKNISEFEALENEKFLILKIGRRDLNRGPLTNLKDSDKGKSNMLVSTKTRELKRQKNLGKTLSEEHKKKIGLSNKGFISPLTIEARKRKIELEGNWFNKKVLQLDLNNNVIQEFSSIKEAHQILKLSRTYAGDRCRLHDLKIINNSYKLIFKYNDNKL